MKINECRLVKKKKTVTPLFFYKNSFLLYYSLLSHIINVIIFCVEGELLFQF